MPESVADLGEFGLIGAVTARYPQGSGVILGPGDDAAVIAAPDGRMVVTTDMLVEGRHFRRDWSSAYDVGRKAAAQNLSDVAAMGARPTAVTVAMGAPKDLDSAWALELADGLRDECEQVGASVIGGDTVSAETIILAVSAFGDLDGREPVLRSGARPGDVLAVCGRLGWAEAGLRVLSRGFTSPRVLVQAHRRPEVPYDAGPEAADVGASAMCDVSDGLLADAGHIAECSGVRISVHSGSLEIPEPMREVGAALGEDPLQWVLAGGDDNALLATFPAELRLPERWRVIGSVVEGAGVDVDGEPHVGRAGHTHFS
ncbi:thiamine-phosphate kinase [Phytoactinopolyspora halotolerans]|uniref:Thiamine-monophosphate kinase n=1 Tax=Phytoactinopolyspora halotolerans TaxID=1981512 RepID=A0A6L9SG62_9ACTN|nr:thiamine-phosphate kinase [Phytoactinopolyspora halotolerans]NEE03628.1 thiamine-phosphate kinase [Phytoactinopolyspora halotolerans]